LTASALYQLSAPDGGIGTWSEISLAAQLTPQDRDLSFAGATFSMQPGEAVLFTSIGTAVRLSASCPNP
jgi:hypothetical protein